MCRRGERGQPARPLSTKSEQLNGVTEMRKVSMLMLVLLSLLSSGTATAQESHCVPGEQVVFSCDTGKKVVSVCASSNGIQYRYGALGSVEIHYPAKKLAMYDGVLYRGLLTFSGGGAEYVRFINDSYEYVVYAGQGRGWSQDGLLAVKAGKVVSRKTCAGVPSMNFSLLDEQGVPQDGDGVASSVWDLVPTE